MSEVWVTLTTARSGPPPLVVLLSALAAGLFPAGSNDPIAREVLFVALFYSGATMIVALISVVRRRLMLAREEQRAAAQLETATESPDAEAPAN